jgi:hypothetical protein
MARVKITDIDIERELNSEELEDVFGGQGGKSNILAGCIYVPGLIEELSKNRFQWMNDQYRQIRKKRLFY